MSDFLKPSTDRDIAALYDAKTTALVDKLTANAKQIEVALTDDTVDPDVLRQLWLTFSLEFEALADDADNPADRTNIQIAAIIQKGIIFRNAGLDLRYLEELDMADIYAVNSGCVAIEDMLSSEISDLVATIDHGPEWLILQLRKVLDDETRVRLWELLVDGHHIGDLIDQVYYEVSSSDDEDPDELLAFLSLTEKPQSIDTRSHLVY